jgi:ATP-dependent RNA helicase DDX24/MAK5
VCVQGSGKTLAFGIPILQRIILAREESAARGGGLPQQLAALILVPTRELGLQVAAHIRAAGEFTSVGVATLVGGMASQKQERLLGYRPAIVVATPGRLWDMIQRGQPHVSDMSGLLALVLDEADRMVAGGHYKELTDILDYVQRRR